MRFGHLSVRHKYRSNFQEELHMARARRFTVRLADQEFALIEGFANTNHVIASVAVRKLIELGLATENRVRLPDGGPNTRHQQSASTG